MNGQAWLFWLLAVMTGAGAIGVLLTQNIVRSATWLLFTLAGVAGIFFLLGADFVGATQLLVYVGGTLVLVVFGVMLTAQGPFITMKTGAGDWAIALAVGLLFFGVLAISILGGESSLPDVKVAPPGMSSPADARNSSSVVLGQALLGLEGATPPADVTGMNDLPRKQVSYLLPFEIVSVHLLVVLIAAAYLARAKRRTGAIV
jgi:NADH-quinone oxidoreductase subunit J